MFPAKVAAGLCGARDKGDLCSLSLLLGLPRRTSEQRGRCQASPLTPKTLLFASSAFAPAPGAGLHAECRVPCQRRRGGSGGRRLGAASPTEPEAAGALTRRAFSPLGSHCLLSASGCFRTGSHRPRPVLRVVGLVTWRVAVTEGRVRNDR